jgi:hypothetical protein
MEFTRLDIYLSVETTTFSGICRGEPFLTSHRNMGSRQSFIDLG